MSKDNEDEAAAAKKKTRSTGDMLRSQGNEKEKKNENGDDEIKRLIEERRNITKGDKQQLKEMSTSILGARSSRIGGDMERPGRCRTEGWLMPGLGYCSCRWNRQREIPVGTWPISWATCQTRLWKQSMARNFERRALVHLSRLAEARWAAAVSAYIRDEASLQEALRR